MELLDTKVKITLRQPTKNRRCDFCHSEEGKPRLVGRFIVQLRRVIVFGEKKLACQTCIQKNEEILASRKNRNKKSNSENHKQVFNLYFHFRQMISRILHVLAFVLLLSTIVVAQPSFPAQPDQTPIDGGLGLLAAVGGAYAYKKLKDRTKEL